MADAAVVADFLFEGGGCFVERLSAGGGWFGDGSDGVGFVGHLSFLLVYFGLKKLFSFELVLIEGWVSL